MTERPVYVDLSSDELKIVEAGLAEWYGPAYCTEEMAAAIGFSNLDQMEGIVDRLLQELPSSRLTATDWARAMLATEVAFASDSLGSGRDWPSSTGYSDEWTIRILRSLQRKLTPIIDPRIGNGLGTRPPRDID